MDLLLFSYYYSTNNNNNNNNNNKSIYLIKIRKFLKLILFLDIIYEKCHCFSYSYDFY